MSNTSATSIDNMVISRSKLDRQCMVLLESGLQPTLFCLHSISGGATFYRKLNLSDGRAVYGISAVGEDLIRTPHESIEEMAEYYIEQIKLIQPQGPYLLCGFSMGGLIAFEIARILELAGDKIGFLGILDTRIIPVSGDHLTAFFNRRENWFTFMNICAGHVDPELSKEDHPFWDLGIQSRLEFLLDVIRNDNKDAMVQPFSMQTLTQYYDLFTKLNIATAKYKLQPYSGCLTYFQTAENPNSQSIDQFGAVVSGDMSIVPIVGSHFKIFSDPNLSQFLGQQLSSLLKTFVPT